MLKERQNHVSLEFLPEFFFLHTTYYLLLTTYFLPFAFPLCFSHQFRPNPFIRKYLEEQGMLHPPVDEVNFLNARVERAKGGPDLRDHPVDDDFLFGQLLCIMLRDAMDELARDQNSFDVAQVDELFRMERRGNAGRAD